jgi:hypothetical protein
MLQPYTLSLAMLLAFFAGVVPWYVPILTYSIEFIILLVDGYLRSRSSAQEETNAGGTSPAAIGFHANKYDGDEGYSEYSHKP